MQAPAPGASPGRVRRSRDRGRGPHHRPGPSPRHRCRNSQVSLADAISRPWTYEWDPRGTPGLIADRTRRVLAWAWAVARLASEWIHQAALAIGPRSPSRSSSTSRPVPYLLRGISGGAGAARLLTPSRRLRWHEAARAGSTRARSPGSSAGIAARLPGGAGAVIIVEMGPARRRPPGGVWRSWSGSRSAGSAHPGACAGPQRLRFRRRRARRAVRPRPLCRRRTRARPPPTRPPPGRPTTAQRRRSRRPAPRRRPAR